MAKVWNNTEYCNSKEIGVGTVRAGHTVLIRCPQGTISSYQVAKIGNTPIKVLSENSVILLMNCITGRLVAKPYSQKCVIVSSVIELSEYNGKHCPRI